MFGQQNDNDGDTHIPEQAIEGVLKDTAPGTEDAQVASTNSDWQHPGLPIDNDPQPLSSAAAPAPIEPVSAPTSSSSADDANPSANDLIDIKQQALQQLTPLVGHLDQSPEERFRTIMMMIQASDDQTLIKDAFEAANKIEDEKARAQALLDIVNEINYFTSQHQN